jgi:hypothetical protein
MNHLLLGASLAGLTFFLWSAVSWGVLPWHHAVYRSFASEDEVARTLRDNAPASGIYGMPEQPKLAPGATKAEREAADKAVYERMQRGPIVTAIVSHAGFGSLPRMLAVALATAIAVAFGFGLLLAQTQGLGYWQRSAFVAGAGLLAGLACRVPDWNWHQYPLVHSLVNIADLCVGWTLAGLVLAHFVRGTA